MTDKIYVISCSQDLAGIGLDRIRTAVDGLEETELQLDLSRVRFCPVIAKEKVPFAVGETKIVDIADIEIPAYHVVIQSMYGSNGMGHLTCIGATEYKSFADKRVATKGMFQSRIKASIMKGDLLGQVIIIPGKKA